MKTHSIVLGLGYGDEGKGLTTSYLCHKNWLSAMVVRFNGGHQAGHTVIIDDKRHVFSSFGSGTLQGIPTYWSKYCTVELAAFLKEYNIILDKLGDTKTPKIYIDPMCPITTLFDINKNQDLEDINHHGSCGVGFGQTLQRNEDNYTLYVKDLRYPTVTEFKLRMIGKYYNYSEAKIDEYVEFFKENMIKFLEVITISTDSILKSRDHIIYEGAQGILLDQDHGFFPHVTRSNTTSKNALELISKYYDIEKDSISIYYASRSYSTKHGNGPFHNESELNLTNNENETNVHNKYQGEFRTAPLSPEFIEYALSVDEANHKGFLIQKHLVVTCLDQYHIDIKDVFKKVIYKFNNVYVSYGPTYETMYKKYEQNIIQ